MTTPNRAPRRVAAKMNLNVATGAPVPGANAQTYTRKTATAGDSKTALNESHSPTGLTPENVQVNK